MLKLLLGGSPCTHWSIAQTRSRETRPEGVGWELFRNYLFARDKFCPDFFLYENNKSMSPAIRERISRELGVEPILINSALLSAQNRQRFYWTNIPNVEPPEDRGILLRDVLDDNQTLVAEHSCGFAMRQVGRRINEKGHRDDYNEDLDLIQRYEVNDNPQKFNCLTTVQKDNIVAVPMDSAMCAVSHELYACEDGGHNVVPASISRRGRKNGTAYEIRSDGKANAVIVGHESRMVIEAADGKTYPIREVRSRRITILGREFPIKLPDGFYIIRKLTVSECKRLQTVPEDYIFPVSDTQAYKMLGNGWTVDVIAHILSHCPGITAEPLAVLSMYDGMSCGHIALDKLGAHISAYWATEIDKYAIQTTQTNYPNTVQLGDAFQVRQNGWEALFAPLCKQAV